MEKVSRVHQEQSYLLCFTPGTWCYPNLTPPVFSVILGQNLMQKEDLNKLGFKENEEENTTEQGDKANRYRSASSTLIACIVYNQAADGRLRDCSVSGG